jgi:hypothetical protein
MELIEDWKNLTDKITKNWIGEYFELDEGDPIMIDWVTDNIGEVFSYGDYWFSFRNILDCYKHNINREQLFLWYEHCLENEITDVSLSEFILAPEEKSRRDMQELERLKNNVKLAKEEFKNALKRI